MTARYKDEDMIGKKFHMLTVLERSVNKRQKSTYICVCDCGNKSIVDGYRLLKRLTVSCGCWGKTVGLRPRKPRIRKISSYTKGLNSMFGEYNFSARKRKIDFQISLGIFETIIIKPCFYCDKPPTQQRFGFCYSGIDRVNPDLGYNEENIVSCCNDCNVAKLDMSYKEFVEWICSIHNTQTKLI